MLRFVAFTLLFSATPAYVNASELGFDVESRYPNVRCNLVLESVKRDLPDFCRDEQAKQARFIDFGSQIEILEDRCGEKKTADFLKVALQHKVYRKDTDKCLDAAERIRDLHLR